MKKGLKSYLKENYYFPPLAFYEMFMKHNCILNDKNDIKQVFEKFS